MRITGRPAATWFPLIQRVAIWSLMVALFAYAVWPVLPWERTRARTIVVYGFSILGEVMTDGIFPAFQTEWRRRRGERIEFISSFAGSGTITNQLILGVPAQVAVLALEPDATRLADRGLIPDRSWRSLPYGGVVNRTPFIIMVRPGNPRRIQDFDDLAHPGVAIVHPDPLTSGGAQWAILAEYGAALRRTHDPAAAYRSLVGIWRNVVAQASSARAARMQFENGFGDALITYEQDGLRPQGPGRARSELVYPRSTILSEHIVVVVSKNIRSGDRALAQSFVDFLWTKPAQRIFVRYGFRSVDDRLNAENRLFGRIRDPFLATDLGGWSRGSTEIIERVWMRRVLQEVGR